MGVLIKWEAPSSEAPYDTVRIYRADAEAGPYAVHDTVPVAYTSYYDITGETTKWYKISFYYTAGAAESQLSEPIQGGKIGGYCSPDDVRDLTSITTSDLTDTELFNIIELAAIQLNGDIQTKRFEEEVLYIDETKDNTIDGSNTTFYTKFFPIGDLDNDMDVDTSDLEVYTIETDGTKTQVTVDSIIANDGQFVLSAAPATSISRLLVTYYSSPLSMSDPHSLIKLACIYLSAHYGYAKLNYGKARIAQFNSTRIRERHGIKW